MDIFISSIAAFCTTIAFLPQAIKVIKTKDTQSISLAMYMVFTTGVLFWFVFGLMIDSYPIIIANIITFFLSGIILIYKIREIKNTSH